MSRARRVAFYERLGAYGLRAFGLGFSAACDVASTLVCSCLLFCEDA